MLRTSIFFYEENHDSNSPQLLNYKRIKSCIAHVVIKTIVHFFSFLNLYPAGKLSSITLYSHSNQKNPSKKHKHI